MSDQSLSLTAKVPALRSRVLGAAALMATSAVGPGFLTQTTVFTLELGAAFGFVILMSVLLDIAAQLNIWRVLVVSGRRAQEVANAVLPGAGYLLAALVAAGGLAFNIGNLGGTGLGAQVLVGVSPEWGAAVSAAVAIALFLFKGASARMDRFVMAMGAVLLVLVGYVLLISQPPLAEAARQTLWPDRIDPVAIVTLVGGTVGGYITFAGAHRLIDGGVHGVEALPQVNRGATSAIVLASLIRVMLFLAVLGVMGMGLSVDGQNPPASVFRLAGGELGYRVFGLVMWSAAITSVIGAAYTSVSFLRTLHPALERHHNALVVAFIASSAGIFCLVGKPVTLLILVGTLNGFILPLGLGLMLMAAHRQSIVGDYRHPRVLSLLGWAVVVIMGAMSLYAATRLLGG
ncbi:NRAMP family divalent metal transporter [Ferrimonas balearica]|uniref:NRAMP family divalent metal transporter n=1 Tax=Ferrimonas balearica TaxID=44012 RepID=UPI001C993DE8|nr:NRAMP family divalent metal transporter [Ferrimonas balearica]MBY5990878.1 divalent metal cation transporter [Ferrimonas balearica]